MTGPQKRVFARRGITPRGALVATTAVLAAFALGIGVGWGTSMVGDELAAPEPSPSPSPSASRTAEPDVSIAPLAPIDREIDEADREAGLLNLEVPVNAEGTFQTVTTDAVPTGDAASVKWVRVEYEDGLELSGTTLSRFVVDTLNDPRGWGAKGRYEFVPTSGAPDLRIVVASPTTAAARCPEPHVAAAVGVVTEGDAAPSPTPSATTSPASVSCADEGLVIISLQDWAAGLDSYGDDRTGARDYLVGHGVGHVLGEEDGTCSSGRALLMTDQSELREACTPNPWPWPDEPLTDLSPEPTASAASEDE